MTAGSTSSQSVSVPGLGVVMVVDKPLVVFELVSAYGTVGLSLGLPMVSPLRTVGFGRPD